MLQRLSLNHMQSNFAGHSLLLKDHSEGEGMREHVTSRLKIHPDLIPSHSTRLLGWLYYPILTP